MTHSHSSFQGLLGHVTRSALQFNFQLKKEPFLLTAAVFPVMVPENRSLSVTVTAWYIIVHTLEAS